MLSEYEARFDNGEIRRFQTSDHFKAFEEAERLYPEGAHAFELFGLTLMGRRSRNEDKVLRMARAL